MSEPMTPPLSDPEDGFDEIDKARRILVTNMMRDWPKSLTSKELLRLLDLLSTQAMQIGREAGKARQ